MVLTARLRRTNVNDTESVPRLMDKQKKCLLIHTLACRSIVNQRGRKGTRNFTTRAVWVEGVQRSLLRQREREQTKHAR